MERAVDSSAVLNLNSVQTSAVLHKQGPFLVLAGAGSGKTRVLTQRIINLVNNEKIDAESILAVTFTNKAAAEMKNRINKSISSASSRDLWIGTFHSICNRILRSEIRHYNEKYSKNFIIIDTDESQSFIKECIKELKLDEKKFQAKKFQYIISGIKNNGQTPEEYSRTAKDFQDIRIAEIYSMYQEKLIKSNSLDFDDLLLITIKILKKNPQIRNYYYERFCHVLVDEFQDTNKIQYDFLNLLVVSSEEKNNWQNRSFCAVGDIDQSIYSWRGADYKIALNFKKDFPEAEIMKLEENYRSTESILKIANSVIKNNVQRIDKVLKCTKGYGEKITVFEAQDEHDESFFIVSEMKRLSGKYKLSDMAVLYRTNAQSRAIEEGLIKAKIPYKIIGGIRFYDRLEIKDLIAYLRLIYNSSDATALKRIINAPRRGIGPSTIAQIEERANKLDVSLYSALSDLLDSNTLTPKITTAIHSFIELIEELKKDAEVNDPAELLRKIINKTAYCKALFELNPDEAEDRNKNIEEFINVAEDFLEQNEEVSLENFLSQISLIGDTDSMKNEEDKVILMTVHSSKGLEFPCVFLTGLEEGVFPHIRAISAQMRDEIEEERRLMYVAITRAEEKLYLTRAKYRRLWGVRESAEESRFFKEMPETELNFLFGNSVVRSLANTRSNFNNVQTKPTTEEVKPKAIFEEGDSVKHITFGKGIVSGIMGSGIKRFYAVSFENNGKKILTPESLKKIEEN